MRIVEIAIGLILLGGAAWTMVNRRVETNIESSLQYSTVMCAACDGWFCRSLKRRIIRRAPLKAAISDNRSKSSPLPIQTNAARWSLANQWFAEGQTDDRPPMDGSVTGSRPTPAARRSFARRCHQLSFKKWSQTRHD